MLKLYNTLHHEVSLFKPRHDKKVSMYVCGVTVYDRCHVGHARVYVVFDFLSRLLEHLGYEVNYVRNITDIDDKIIKRASELGLSMTDLTDRYIAYMQEDFSKLGIRPPTTEPKATDSIPQIIALIDQLMAAGHAYQSITGDILFKVESYETYGALSNQHLEDLRSGARVEVAEGKECPMDFVLWKMAKAGEPSWSSPWGQGRPGWHIECSAMALEHLGPHFDIHGGGHDLTFPHHENERAQSECASHQTYVENWMHVGFVNINNEKMSKSLNNFFTIEEVLTEFHPEVVRYFLLASHYRSPVNYSRENLNVAKESLATLYGALRNIEPVSDSARTNSYHLKFMKALYDDLNTPIAFSVLFELAKQINIHRDSDLKAAQGYAYELKELAAILGLLGADPTTFLQSSSQVDAASIASMIEARNLARANKNWAEADAIRKSLEEQGIALEDKDGKTIWRSV